MKNSPVKYKFYHERLQGTLWWIGMGLFFLSREVKAVVGERVTWALILICFAQYWFRRRVKHSTEVAEHGFQVITPTEIKRDVTVGWLPSESPLPKPKTLAWRLGNWVWWRRQR